MKKQVVLFLSMTLATSAASICLAQPRPPQTAKPAEPQPAQSAKPQPAPAGSAKPTPAPADSAKAAPTPAAKSAWVQGQALDVPGVPMKVTMGKAPADAPEELTVSVIARAKTDIAAWYKRTGGKTPAPKDPPPPPPPPPAAKKIYYYQCMIDGHFYQVVWDKHGLLWWAIDGNVQP